MITEKISQNYTGYVSIKQGDWDYPCSMVEMANRIVYDWKFEEDCKKRILNRERFLKRGEAL